ncbi:bifunctional DNA-binding transcriptional regulator/O6-methylguanine-DNA methyltransferase Ada [bacterium]|nr:bifunctional DNA-binding transcriptional regulator/O6-methylguanine-DNA methyltransferase Ada [bacterium]
MKSLLRTKSNKVREASRWRAVQHRDERANGTFVFAVKTTGIYCKPSCPAKRANRENVLFYDSFLEAEAAGFRPCKRCRPQLIPSTIPHAEAIIHACRTVELKGDSMSLRDLAREAGMSPFHFSRVFKEATGVTPKAYANALRARRMRTMLQSSRSVEAAIQRTGYRSVSRFYADAEGQLGMTPSALKSRGKRETITYALMRCSLGHLLVASTAKGICTIELGDDPLKLLADFKNRFADATLVAGDKSFVRTAARVIALMESPKVGLDLPLDIRGTAFQHRVWQALRKIPAGETITYSELAERLGCPRSVRAVASACAANRIAVAVPCHRVVRIGGNLAGYYWGIERKKELINREKRDSAKGSD